MQFVLKQLIAFALLSFAFTSCTEHHEYVVKGRLVKDCQSNEPLANQTFLFMSDRYKNGGLIKNPGLNRWVTTDANGYFEFVYSTKKLNSNPIYIDEVFYSEPDSINNPIMPGENVDLGVFPIGLSFDYTINLSVNNPYSSNDTLYILGTGNSVLQIIPGPFSSGQIGTFNYAYALGNLEYDENGFYKEVSVRIKSNILVNPSSSSTAKKWFQSASKIRMCDHSTQVFDVGIN